MMKEQNSARFVLTKVFFETLVIVFSVFMAIYFEDLWQDRKQKQEANRLLCELKLELAEDLNDIDSIIKNQRWNSKHYQVVVTGLSRSGFDFNQEIDAALHEIGKNNRTLYPRIATWSILLSNGLFAEIDDKELSVKLMNYYESFNKRIYDNGEGYDRTLNEMLRIHIPEYWDFLNKKPLASDHKSTSKFRAQIEHVYRDWNLYYIELLIKHKANTQDLINHLGNCNEKSNTKVEKL